MSATQNFSTGGHGNPDLDKFIFDALFFHNELYFVPIGYPDYWEKYAICWPAEIWNSKTNLHITCALSQKLQKVKIRFIPRSYSNAFLGCLDRNRGFVDSSMKNKEKKCVCICFRAMIVANCQIYRGDPISHRFKEELLPELFRWLLLNP